MTFFAATLVFALDRLTKIVVVNTLASGQSVKIVPGVLNLTLVFNNGTAFSLLKGQNTALSAVSALVIAFIVIYTITHRDLSIIVSSAVGLILGGALGNLLDRLKFGSVIDFIDLRVWPVFNIADSSITIGMVLLAWAILKNNYKSAPKTAKQ